MADELELELDNEPGGEPNEELSDDQLREELARLRRQAEQAEQTAKQLGEQNNKLTEYITQQYIQQYTNEPAAPEAGKPTIPEAPKAGAEPDRDEDPDAWMEWRIAKGVEQAVTKIVKPLQDQYTSDRKTLLSTAGTSAKQQVSSFFADFAKYDKDITAYLNQFGPEAQANPAAWEEAYYRIKGRAVALAEREAATRETAASDGRGRPSASASAGADGEPLSTPLTGRAERFARHEKMSEKDWSDFSASSMSIDDYLAAKAKREKNKRRAS